MKKPSTTVGVRTLEGIDTESLIPLLSSDPLVRIFTNSSGTPREASGMMLVDASHEQVWRCVRDMYSLHSFIKMVDSVRRLPPGPFGEELVQVNLRFKIAIFSTRFQFVAQLKRKEGRWVELSYYSGKVRDLIIRFELAPAPKNQTILLCLVGFDIHSLSWLVDIFVRHHPEIEWGIHAGSVMSIIDSVRKMATKQHWMQ